VDLIRRAKALGLDGAVITEHYSYEASLPVEQVGRDEGFLILRGVEIATDKGHLLAYGMEGRRLEHLGARQLPAAGGSDRARINELGGICAPAHPFRNVGLASLMEGLLELKDIAAVESHNGVNADSDNDLAISASGHLGLPTLGGSDCHKTPAVGRCATEFLQPVHDMASFIAAVKAGACRGAYYPGYRVL
jgi:predicted metal-dependent phosphoesterase TrpH